MMKKDIEAAITKDSSAQPFKAQKKVILCRSGKQIYHHTEVEHLITPDNKPPVEKDFYVEYRPASVVVDAQDLCRSLPVTLEHPEGWVDGETFNELVGGTTDKEVKVVSLKGKDKGEVGLETTLTFYSDKLYDYYLQSNKEVSLGYLSVRRFVDNPEDVGYDILLEKIEMVNHVALTSNGRGGSSVAVIDSLFGGLKPMKTGIFAGLNIFSKKEKNFGEAVCDSVKKSKGSTEEELAKDMASVLDSCATLVDGEAKNTLMDAVKDSFEHKDLTLENKEEIAARLNSIYNKAEAATKDSFDKVIDADKEEPEEKEEDSKLKVDVDEKEEDKKTDDSEKEEPEDKTEGSEEKEEKEDKAKDGCKDSEFVTKAELDSVKDSIIAEMKDTLGKMLNPEDGKPAGGAVEDGVKDSAPKSTLYGMKYADFIN